MKTNEQNFTTSILVDQSPAEAFIAINDPRAWWSAGIGGITDKVGEEWTYNFGESHRSKIKTIELVPGKKVVWLVEENHFAFTKDPHEWEGNSIIFDISEKDGKTEVVFTQVGLVPSYECYKACHDGWTGFVQKSLQKLITTGKGDLKWYEPA